MERMKLDILGLAETVRKATVLHELIRGWGNGENVEVEDRVQIEDDVADVFDIPVVGDSAGVYVPDGERAIVVVLDVESAVVDVFDGERDLLLMYMVERVLFVDIADVKSDGVDVPDGESTVVSLKFGPEKKKGRRKGQYRTSRFAKKRMLATNTVVGESAVVHSCDLCGVCGDMEVAREFSMNG
ncbi:hypothetical protein PoB_005396200 [Plakobranchus ocellatus]|uniref:Uncharacterized protein n=1 Tax=Plakobranchus ocellatus TaxID=259542 RepID=A0AAV4C7W8_9GAST|nr:hypothetical protein PoB_005396200 [Plakobranchus ocellatus]